MEHKPMGVTIEAVNTSNRDARYGNIAVLTVNDDGRVSMEPYDSYESWMVGQEQRLGLVASETIVPEGRGRVQIAGPFAATVDMLDMFKPVA